MLGVRSLANLVCSPHRDSILGALSFSDIRVTPASEIRTNLGRALRTGETFMPQ